MSIRLSDEVLLKNFQDFCKKQISQENILLFYIRDDSTEDFRNLPSNFFDLAKKLRIPLKGGKNKSSNLDELVCVLQKCTQISDPKKKCLGYKRLFAVALRRMLLKILWSRMVRRALQVLRDLEDPGNDPSSLSTYRFDIGLEKLDKYFETFGEYEELLFGANDYQRDHTLHVFRVFLIGITLLFYPGINGTEPSGMNGDQKKPRIPRKIAKSNVLALPEKEEKNNYTNRKIAAAWTIAALCHDLGYPLESIEKINHKVSGMLEFFGLSTLSPLKYTISTSSHFLYDLLLKWIACSVVDGAHESGETLLSNQNDALASTIVATALDNHDHGIISAALLLKNIAYFQEKAPLSEKCNASTGINMATRSAILKAIALHNLPGMLYYRWDFPMLLFLCDELQEWDRPTSRERIEMPIETQVSLQMPRDDRIEIHIRRDATVEDVYNYSCRKFKRFIEVFRNSEGYDREVSLDISISTSIELSKEDKKEIEEKITKWNKQGQKYPITNINKDSLKKCSNFFLRIHDKKINPVVLFKNKPKHTPSKESKQQPNTSQGQKTEWDILRVGNFLGFM